MYIQLLVVQFQCQRVNSFIVRIRRVKAHLTHSIDWIGFVVVGLFKAFFNVKQIILRNRLIQRHIRISHRMRRQKLTSRSIRKLILIEYFYRIILEKIPHIILPSTMTPLAKFQLKRNIAEIITEPVTPQRVVKHMRAIHIPVDFSRFTAQVTPGLVSVVAREHI
jgi:hypothetical protein